MATLEKIRNRAGILVAVVIGLALFAFILGDFLESGGSLYNRSQLEIAEIAGTSIPYELYQSRIEENENLQKMFSGETSMDEQTMERIREQVWQQMLREYVMEEQYQRLGIAIHPDELFDMVQGRNIHPIIQQQFGNPQTGEVNKAFITQFLKNMDRDPSGRQKTYWLYLENEIKKDREFSKYTNLIRKGLYVTNLQAKRSQADRDTKVDFQFVNLKLSSIPDSTISISSGDLKKYYESHLQDYEQKASRDIEYVIFPVNPSSDDVKDAENWINRAKDEFSTIEDPKQYVTLNSDSPFDGKNYKKGELPAEINDWAFEAKVGEVTGPYYDGTSYKLARLVAINNLPDSVKARHILVSPKGQSAEAYTKAKATADSLLKVAKANPGKFAQLAKEFSTDPGSKDKGGDLGWFREGMMEKPFNDACFGNKKGEIVLAETQYGFHIIEVMDKGKEVKKVQVAVLERKVIASSATNQKVYSEASEFAGLNKTYSQFISAAEAKKLTKRMANNLLENDRRIAGLESPRELIRWAFKAKKGEVSTVFEFGNNFVVATLTAIREEGNAPLEQVRDDVRIKVLREKKGQILADKMREALKGSNSLDEVAQKLNAKVEQASRISFSSFSIPSAGVEPAVIATASVSAEGRITGPIIGNNGVFAINVTAINKDESDLASERMRLANSYQSRAYYEAFEALKKNANIKDKRAKFY
jgi:peptidyl-prolyl cis-trans isomerase D